jgi:hypothetical protein
MIFEKCLHCAPNQWQAIAPDQLQRELAEVYPCADALIDLIAVDPKSTIETATAKYRKWVPEKIKDWAKP